MPLLLKLAHYGMKSTRNVTLGPSEDGVSQGGEVFEFWPQLPGLFLFFNQCLPNKKMHK